MRTGLISPFDTVLSVSYKESDAYATGSIIASKFGSALNIGGSAIFGGFRNAIDMIGTSLYLRVLYSAQVCLSLLYFYVVSVYLFHFPFLREVAGFSRDMFCYV